MLQYDFEESVGYWVALTSQALRRELDARLAAERITLRQWEVLAWLAVDGELSQTELADRLGIEAPTLAGILSRMERDGWLERCSCPLDRRKKRVRPTEKVEPIWNRVVRCCREVRAQAIEGISEDELAVFKSVCARIRDNLTVPREAAIAAEVRH